MTTTDPHVVYRLFGRRSALLYVGITNDTSVRFRAHEQAKWWWSKVVDVQIVEYSSRSEALRAEAEAIRSERPKFNIRGYGPTFTSRFRVARDKWRRFGAAAALLGSDKSKLINDFVDWVLRERDAKLPTRPTRAQVAAWLVEHPDEGDD